MAKKKQKPNGSEAKKVEQPIPSEKLKDFYIRDMELQKMIELARGDFQRLLSAHGVKEDAWIWDLRNGLMLTKPPKDGKKDPAYRGPRRPKIAVTKPGAPSN